MPKHERVRCDSVNSVRALAVLEGYSERVLAKLLTAFTSRLFKTGEKMATKKKATKKTARKSTKKSGARKKSGTRKKSGKSSAILKKTGKVVRKVVAGATAGAAKGAVEAVGGGEEQEKK
jgi:hypothetical protein